MEQIAPFRTRITPRFPIASFAVRVPSNRWYEIACATDPALFHSDNRGRRTAGNFFTSREQGLVRADESSSTFMLPPDRLCRFAGASRVYYALATYADREGNDPRFSISPDALDRVPALALSPDFTGRGLDRTRIGTGQGSRYAGGNEPVLVWGGDLALAQERRAARSAAYDDGFDPSLWGNPERRASAEGEAHGRPAVDAEAAAPTAVYGAVASAAPQLAPPPHRSGWSDRYESVHDDSTLPLGAGVAYGRPVGALAPEAEEPPGLEEPPTRPASSYAAYGRPAPPEDEAPGLEEPPASASPAYGDPRSASESAGLLGDIIDAVNPIGTIFSGVVLTNKASATQWAVPADYPARIRAYAAHNPADGAILLAALARNPTFHSGGWILSLQPNASAMTLDTAVFFRGQSLNICTYAHELVHVQQYGLLGATAFLVSYFGLSAVTIAERLVRRQPLNVMNSSPHEVQGYDIGNRFCAWARTQPWGVGLALPGHGHPVDDDSDAQGPNLHGRHLAYRDEGEGEDALDEQGGEAASASPPALGRAELSVPEKLRISEIVAVAESGAEGYSAAFPWTPRQDLNSDPSTLRSEGLLFGYLLFDQQSGALGEVIKAAWRRSKAMVGDPAFPEDRRLERLLGVDEATIEQLIASTNADDRQARLGPVEGAVLWREPWLSRFRRAGAVDYVQAAQREVAVTRFLDPHLEFARWMGLTTDRALGFVMDRCVDMGRVGGPSWIARVAGPIRTRRHMEAALRELGFSRLSDFQESVQGLEASGRWDARTHAAMARALRGLDSPMPVLVPTLGQMLDSMVAEAGTRSAMARLQRLRSTSRFTDTAYRLD